MKKIKLDIQKFATDNTVEVELIAAAEELEKSMNSAMKSIRNLKGTVKETKDEVTGFKKAAKDISNAFDLSKGLDIRGITNQIKRLGRSLYTDFLSKAVDTSEELNLFNVVFDNIEKDGKETFSELGKEALQFQNKLNEAFGTNRKETMRYQGLFQAMGESAGLSEDISALMSENMTKLAYDLASLYNTTETKAAESLRAGVYAGQTKPLRNYGIDVTQTSFKPIMEELGLEKSVNELTQAEKEVLRYISTLRQAENAMGDFANTIESPANQLKVLKQQFYEMQAAIGNLFVGAFARILPYVNAVIMVIKEVAKAIASLFGIKMKDYNTGIASYTEDLDDYSEGLGGIADSAGSAGEAIKALKRQTLGFDQINNLTSPTPTAKGGSGGGGGAGGGIIDGIDSKLLDALKGYENGMEKVKMKATELRDKIMSILGFTKHINEETGEVYFTYEGWQATVKGLWGWFKSLNPLAKLFVGIGLPAAFVTLFNIIKKISGATGVTTVLKGILTVSKNLLSPLGALSTSMLAFGKAALSGEKSFASLKTGLSMGVQSWREQQGIIDKTTGKLNGFTGVVQGAKNVLLGLGEVATGFSLISAGAEDAALHGENMLNSFERAGGTIMSIFGGVQAGAVFGPWGAAIGGVIGAIAALVAELKGADDALKYYNNSMQESINSAYKDYQARSEQVVIAEHYITKLKDLFDETGHVKQGEEEHANFILGKLSEALGQEYKLKDGIVYINGQEYKIIDDVIKKTQEYIDQKKLQIMVESYQKAYADALKQQSIKQQELNDLEAKRKGVLKDLDKAVQDGTLSEENHQLAVQEVNKEYGRLKDEVEDKYSKSAEVIKNYNGLLKASAEGNTAEGKKYFDELVKGQETVSKTASEEMEKTGNRVKTTLSDSYIESKKNLDKTFKEAKTLETNINKLDPNINIKTTLPTTSKVQNDVNARVGPVKGNVGVNLLLPSQYSFQQSVNSLLSGTSGTMELKVGPRRKADGGVYANGRWQNIQAYANGGIPAGGQLFMAREAGPELVGKIGKHTAVMNNNQIVDSVKAGVYEAVSAAMSNSGMGSVQIDLHTDEGVVVDRINKITRQTGECPINF